MLSDGGSAALLHRVLGVLFAFSPVLLTSPAPAAVGAAEILRRAEEVRNPELDYIADFTIDDTGADGGFPQAPRSYSMIVRGRSHTLILKRTPRQFFGATVLLDRGDTWMLLPRSTAPFQLMSAIVRGEVSLGDVMRVSLAENYESRLLGETTYQGETCYSLALTSTRPSARYPRIEAWITKKRFLPRKLAYYARTGACVKTVRYGNFRMGRLGLHPMTVEIEGDQPWEGTSTLEFSGLRRIDTRAIFFTPDGLRAFRDAALSRLEAEGVQVSPERFLPALGRLNPKRGIPSAR